MVAEYSKACRETLALPTILGVKSPKERWGDFFGGVEGDVEV